MLGCVRTRPGRARGVVGATLPERSGAGQRPVVPGRGGPAILQVSAPRVRRTWATVRNGCRRGGCWAGRVWSPGTDPPGALTG